MSFAGYSLPAEGRPPRTAVSSLFETWPVSEHSGPATFLTKEE